MTPEELIQTAIQISELKLQSALDNVDKVPSEYYSELSNRADRRAEMWLTPHFALLKQKGQWFGTSSANVKGFRVKDVVSSETTDQMIERLANEPNPHLAIMPPKKRGRPFKQEP